MNGKVEQGRWTAGADGEVVVFLIGMRINRLRAVRDWLPVVRAMPPMLRELSADPGIGLLATRSILSGPREVGVVQYWSSADALMSYASAPDGEHRPAWAAFNKKAREARGSVGIWHETYVVQPGGYENVYVDMPAYGLGAAYGTIPVGKRGDRARQRLAKAGS